MDLSNYYTSGEFARMANVSIRTIRYYDKQNILKPSYVKPTGARFYTESDFVRLQQILLLKYLGFSLDDIREMTIGDVDSHFIQTALTHQLHLVEDKIEQMQMVRQAIQNTASAIESSHDIDWSQMLDLIHLTNTERSLKSQYQNASNISARIHLHQEYSQNPQGWFPWIYENCHIKDGMEILEIGCGDGTLWTKNQEQLPKNISVTLSDISEGMVRDARRNIGPDKRFHYATFDCHDFPYADNSYDLVIANHVMFYCQNLPQVCEEIRRVLKPDGFFICSTYGNHHMQEITSLVQKYDKHIYLSANKLYENFGLENGARILKPHFSEVNMKLYEDSLLVTRPEPLIDYILSCHGNQNQYLLEHYKDFQEYVEKKTRKGFRITKDAGVFVCRK